MNRILVAPQVADAAAHAAPRGNFSDLYPQWLGARELLSRGRDPYSPEITREIQQGYYGRPLDPARAGDPKNQQRFAYPVYVVFLLAPTIGLPFEIVRVGFGWFLIGLAVLSVVWWFRVLRWGASFWALLIAVVLMLGWLPMAQGIRMQQMSLLVAALLAAAGACLAGGWLFCAGGLVALATIKPQLAWPLVAWLLLWVGKEWHSRRRFIFGFGLVMALLLGGAELVLPGWWRMFLQTIGQYHQYTHNESALSFLFGLVPGRIIGFASVLACTACIWHLRGEPASSAAFGQSFALVLALTVMIVPMLAPYNQVLLAPAILALVRRETASDCSSIAIRLARRIGALLLIWPWIAIVCLIPAYIWLTPIPQSVGIMPFYSILMLPIFIFGLTLADTWMNYRSTYDRAQIFVSRMS